MANEKMNIYLITKDKVSSTTKDGRWFKELFLPTISQNKPLQNKVTVDMYWKAIRDVLFGKNKKTKLKVVKRKDIKFVAFPCKNNTVVAFVTGNDKSDALKDIYKLTVKEDKIITATQNNNKQTNKVFNNDKPGSKLFELIKKELKQFGEVKRVDQIKLNDVTARINIQIVTKKTDEQMWDVINEIIKPIFSNKFYVEVEEVSNMGCMNTLLCPVILHKRGGNNGINLTPVEEKTINNKDENEKTLYCAEINNIEWDTYDDGEGETYDPAELELPKGVSIYNIEADSIEDAKDQLAELLSQEYNYLVSGFDIVELKEQTENNHKNFENETIYKTDKSEEKIADKSYKFEIRLYKDGPFESEEEYKKWEHHFDYLYGDTSHGNYWGIKVQLEDGAKPPYVSVIGNISGVSDNDFVNNIRDNMYAYEFNDVDLGIWEEMKLDSAFNLDTFLDRFKESTIFKIQDVLGNYETRQEAEDELNRTLDNQSDMLREELEKHNISDIDSIIESFEEDVQEASWER